MSFVTQNYDLTRIYNHDALKSMQKAEVAS